MNLPTMPTEGAFRVLANYTIPGCVASAPYIVIFAIAFPPLRSAWNASPSASVTVVGLIILTVGLLLDSLGGWFEVNVIERVHDDRELLKENWYKYLNIKYEFEPIGHRYLSRVLLLMKFAINLFLAIIFALLGLVVLHFVVGVMDSLLFWSLCSSGIALEIYLYIDARETSYVLARIREELVDSYYDSNEN